MENLGRIRIFLEEFFIKMRGVNNRRLNESSNTSRRIRNAAG